MNGGRAAPPAAGRRDPWVARSLLVNGKIKATLVLGALTLAFPLLVLLGFGVAAEDDPVSESHSVTLDGASSADVEIRLNAGELWLAGGSSVLMDGTFAYSDADWQPEIEYGVNDGVGRLAIDQGGGPDFVAADDWDDVENSWDIRLGGGLPID